MSATKGAPIRHGGVAVQEQVDWPQDPAAHLDDRIRRAMTDLNNPALADTANAAIGTLINERIELSYQRGLRAALATVRKK